MVKDIKEKWDIWRAKEYELKRIRMPERLKIRKKISLNDDQSKEIDSYYKKYLGETIPKDWHKHYMAFTGNYDKRYFPDILYIPEFERYMNLYSEYNKVYEDKNLVEALTHQANVKCVETVASCRRGLFYVQEDIVNSIDILVAKVSELNCLLFLKPSVDSSSGENCRLIHLVNGVDKVSGESGKIILQKYNGNFLIQKLLKCHDSVRKIYPNSVNTFRVITYRWKNEIYHCPTIMRIGRGNSFVDNAHAGGMFIGISDEGNLKRQAFTEFKDEFFEHPDTHLVFDGYKIEGFPKVLNAAKKMHAVIPEIGVVNWDFTLDETNEPVLIEINIGYGSLWMTQMANGVGAFMDNTDEILLWIKKMRSVNVDERYKYKFGNME